MSQQDETWDVTAYSPPSITIAGSKNLDRQSKRVPTARTLNASCVDVVLPEWIVNGFQHLVDNCNLQPPLKQARRLVARDFHEEALAVLGKRMDAGEKVLFLAAPIRNGLRKKLWIDGEIKTLVEDLAYRADVTQGSVVVTAFHDFLEARGPRVP